jgi:hypothetical protein
MVFISIITAVDGKVSELNYTTKSLSLQQNAPEVEWILIAAPEDGKPVFDEYRDLAQHLIFEKTDDPYQAMNLGLEKATGEYVWFLDSGDCLADVYTLRDLKRESVASVKPGLLFTDARINGRIRPAKDIGELSYGMIAPLQACLYRRDTIGTTRFDAAFGEAADYAFTLAVAAHSKRVHHFTRVIADIQTVRLTSRTGSRLARRTYLNQPEWKNSFYDHVAHCASTLRRLMKR